MIPFYFKLRTVQHVLFKQVFISIWWQPMANEIQRPNK